MNTYFIKRFIARTAVVLSAAALFCGCSDDDETSTLHFDKPCLLYTSDAADD